MSESSTDNNTKAVSASERRVHRRLEVRLPLEFHRLGGVRQSFAPTVTGNVSTGGVYFETTVDDIFAGEELQIDLGVPPGDDRFPQHGKITTTAEVIRAAKTDKSSHPDAIPLPKYGIAARFRQGFRLTF